MTSIIDTYLHPTYLSRYLPITHGNRVAKNNELCDFNLGDCDVTLAWEDLKDAAIYNYVDVSFETLYVTTH